MNLQRDSSHQGFPYHQSQEALSVPSKALKPKKPRSSSCLSHRNHFPLYLSFKHRHHLVCASFERAIIISQGCWAVAALGWSGDWSALFFWAIPTSLEIALEPEVIICSREPNRKFLIMKQKSRKVPSCSQKREASYFERERDLMAEKNDSAKMVFGLRHHPTQRKFFWVCLLAVLGSVPGNNRISVASGNCQSCYLGCCCLPLFVTTFLHLPTFLMNKHTYFLLGSLNFRFSTESENFELPTSHSGEKVVHQDRIRADGVSTDNSLK